MSNLPLSRARARRLRTLHARRHREESGLFLAEGVRLVEELVSSPLGIDSAVVAPSLEDTPRGRALLDRLRARAPIETATESELRELAETESPQGVVAVARIPRHSLPATLSGRVLVLPRNMKDRLGDRTKAEDEEIYLYAEQVKAGGTR